MQANTDPTCAQPPGSPDLAATISQRLAEARPAKDGIDRPLRVIYFHPKDVDPLTDYQQRLTRSMLDIQDFYRTEMLRNGLGAKTFALELRKGRLRLHVVQGNAPSRYVYVLGGKWKQLLATVGLQKGAGSSGSGIFVIKGDDKTLYKSSLLKDAATDDIELDIQGVKTLELIVESGKQGNGRCWTIWGEARVTR